MKKSTVYYFGFCPGFGVFSKAVPLLRKVAGDEYPPPEAFLSGRLSGSFEQFIQGIAAKPTSKLFFVTFVCVMNALKNTPWLLSLRDIHPASNFPSEVVGFTE